jgi:dynein heavy chain
MGLLREKQRQLAEVEAMIAGLEAKFNQTVAEKDTLEAEMELTSNRLNRAGRLNVALGDEQTRWEKSIKVSSKSVLQVCDLELNNLGFCHGA